MNLAVYEKENGQMHMCWSGATCVHYLIDLEGGDGFLPAWAPGGYPLYYVTEGMQTICPSCANDTDKSDPPEYAEVNWEESSLSCDDCYKWIPSDYGDDE